MKKIMILFDLPDLLKRPETASPIIKQLYVILYSLQHTTGMDTGRIRVNDRSGLAYHSLWEKSSMPAQYIDPFLECKSWNDISFLEYDLLICHPDYEVILYNFLFDKYHFNFDERKIYTMISPEKSPAGYLFTRVAQLFVKGGPLALSDTFKTTRLRYFKDELAQHYISPVLSNPE